MATPKLKLIVTPEMVRSKQLAVAKAEADYADYVRQCRIEGKPPALGRSIPKLMARLDLTAAKRAGGKPSDT